MELRFRCAFISFYIESEIPTTTKALLLRFYCALAVFATIRVILTKISNRGGIAVQWNGGLSVSNPVDSLFEVFLETYFVC